MSIGYTALLLQMKQLDAHAPLHIRLPEDRRSNSHVRRQIISISQYNHSCASSHLFKFETTTRKCGTKTQSIKPRLRRSKLRLAESWFLFVQYDADNLKLWKWNNAWLPLRRHCLIGKGVEWKLIRPTYYKGLFTDLL